MKLKIENRQYLSAAVIFFYLIPLLFFIFYSISLMSKSKSWVILSVGLLILAIGALAFILTLYYWEGRLREKLREEQGAVKEGNGEKEPKVMAFDSSLIKESNFSHLESHKEKVKELNSVENKDNPERHVHLLEEIQSKSQEIRQLEEERKQLIIKVEQVTQDYADYKLFSEEQLKQKSIQLNILQQTIEEQKMEMERRQEQIQQLDAKVHDLSYEIKTLLYLQEHESTPSKHTTFSKTDKLALEQNGTASRETMTAVIEPTNHKSSPAIDNAEAAAILKRCLLSAQKLTGALYYAQDSARYRGELPSPHYSIDQRRLFDSLRSETGALIIVYSPRENRLLFANQETKQLLGWNPEKFMQDFFSLLQDGIVDWKKVLNLLITSSEAQTRLLLKSKQGQEILMHCHAGTVSSGLFKNYVIGILYPA